jgi:membrane-associated phospholipid phosphatase
VWIAIALVLALYRRRLQPLVLVVIADAAAEGFTDALKAAVGESRPHVSRLVALPHSHAFPSGHTSTSFACATVLSVLAPRLAPAFVLLAAAIAYSRLYVGVHWPLDVVGGAVLGVAIALLLLSAARRRSGGRRRSG